MLNHFKIASASIIGETHRRMWKNNQDSLKVAADTVGILSVICDGCGASPHSELGSILTADFTAEFCMKNFRDGSFIESMLRNKIYELYEGIAKQTSPDSIQNYVYDNFLCTIIGCMVTPETTTIFSSGDGIWMVNEEWEEIDQNNTPRFLGYKITHGLEHPITIKQIKTRNTNRILIGSDGMSALWRDGRNPQKVLDDLFSMDEFFEHPGSLSKFLSNFSGLNDDTSVVMLKR